MVKHTLMMHPKFLQRAALLPKNAKSKLVRILWLLSENIAHPSLQCKKVKGARTNVYECRVDRSVRLIYDSYQGVLRCWYVGEHSSALGFAKSAKVQTMEIPVDDINLSYEMQETDLLSVTHFLASGKIDYCFQEMDLDEVIDKIST